jgi:hypothetical protein
MLRLVDANLLRTSIRSLSHEPNANELSAAPGNFAESPLVIAPRERQFDAI